jgi:hypothetical protein
MALTNTLVNACLDLQECIVRQTSTNAPQILAQTEAFALISLMVSNASVQEDITTLVALVMSMNVPLSLAFMEDAKMA